MNSPRFSPAARTRTSTCCGPGSGTATSRSSSVVLAPVVCIQYDCISTPWSRLTALSDSLPGKYRLALFHERAPAFGIVFALEAAADQPLAHLQVELRGRLENFGNDGLAGAHRQRRVDRHCRRIFGKQRVELPDLAHARDQSDRLGFLRVDFSGGEKQVLGFTGT